MLSNGFDAPICLELSPSRLFIRFQTVTHFIALIAIMLPSELFLAVKMGLAVLIIVHFYYFLRQYFRKFRRNETLFWQKGKCWLSCSDKSETYWFNLPGSLATPWFVLINLYNDTGKRCLLVFRDQCDAQTFRRLKVRLKFFQGDAAIPTDAK